MKSMLDKVAAWLPKQVNAEDTQQTPPKTSQDAKASCAFGYGAGITTDDYLTAGASARQLGHKDRQETRDRQEGRSLGFLKTSKYYLGASTRQRGHAERVEEMEMGTRKTSGDHGDP